MFGNVVKFYYNSTVSIVQLCPQSIYIFGTSVVRFSVPFICRKQTLREPKGEARHKSQYSRLSHVFNLPSPYFCYFKTN